MPAKQRLYRSVREEAEELTTVEVMQRRKALTRVLGVLFTIPVAVAAFYLLLLAYSTLLWPNDPG
jgi:hypothetical protein